MAAQALDAPKTVTSNETVGRGWAQAFCLPGRERRDCRDCFPGSAGLREVFWRPATIGRARGSGVLLEWSAKTGTSGLIARAGALHEAFRGASPGSWQRDEAACGSKSGMTGSKRHRLRCRECRDSRDQSPILRACVRRVRASLQTAARCAVGMPVISRATLRRLLPQRFPAFRVDERLPSKMLVLLALPTGFEPVFQP
jgi:hypothetical protein